MATGILNIQLFYAALPFSFYTAHFYGAWVLMAAFVVHVLIRFGRMVQSLRSRSLVAELRTPVGATEPEPPDPDDLVSPDPGAAVRARSRTTSQNPGDLHDPDGASAAYLMAAAILQL